jgi:hypothetical protein
MGLPVRPTGELAPCRSIQPGTADWRRRPLGTSRRQDRTDRRRTLRTEPVLFYSVSTGVSAGSALDSTGAADGVAAIDLRAAERFVAARLLVGLPRRTAVVRRADAVLRFVADARFPGFLVLVAFVFLAMTFSLVSCCLIRLAATATAYIIFRRSSRHFLPFITSQC